MAMELTTQCPEMDAIVVPTGGGGMAAGIAMWVKSRWPNCKGSRECISGNDNFDFVYAVFCVVPDGKDLHRHRQLDVSQALEDV